MHKKYLYATLLYLAFLSTIIFLANSERASSFFDFWGAIDHADKAGHFFLMGIFSFLLNSTIRCREVKIANTKILLGSLIVGFIVLTEEVSQVFVASRNSNVLDMLFDILGIYLFGVLAKRVMFTSTSPRL